MKAPAVLCVGRVYCDLVFSGLQEPPQPGREIYAQGLSLHTGGGAAITAHTLAKLGRAVQVCASLPAQPFRRIIETDLEDSVCLRHCTEQQESDPQITVVLSGDYDRSFITRRADRALPQNYRECLLQCAREGQIAHLHVAELATLLDHPDLIPLARSAGWSISLDCAWDDAAISSRDAPALIHQVDLFLPNEAEFCALKDNGFSVKDMQMVVIKRGESGAQVRTPDGVIEQGADTSMPCVDTTGAGDAFDAGFIDAWLRNEAVENCLVAGQRTGTAATRHFGGINR